MKSHIGEDVTVLRQQMEVSGLAFFSYYTIKGLFILGGGGGGVLIPP